MKITILQIKKNRITKILKKISNNSLYQEKRLTANITGCEVVKGWQYHKALSQHQASGVLKGIVGDLSYNQTIELVETLGDETTPDLDDSNLKIGDSVVSDIHGDGDITSVSKELVFVEFDNHSGAYYKSTLRSIRNVGDTISKKLLPKYKYQKGKKCKI